MNLSPEDLDAMRKAVREEVANAIPEIVKQVVEALKRTNPDN